MAEHRSAAAATIRVLVWTLASVPLALLALALAVAAAGTVDSVVNVGHAPYISLSVGLWPPLATAVAVVVARLVGLPVVSSRFRAAALVAVAGGIATALAQFGVMAWTEARFGYFDPEFVSSTALLPLPMAALTASAGAWLVTITAARTMATVGIVGSLAILGLLAATNLKGAFDGLSEAWWLLGLTYAAGCALVGVVLVTVWTHRRGA